MTKLTFWLMFVPGWSVHSILQAKASSTSKSNSLHTSWDWFKLSWQVVLARGFLAALAMELWCEAPTVFGASLGVALAAPMTKATAGIFGYAADSVLDKLGASFGLIKLDIPRTPVLADSEPKPPMPQMSSMLPPHPAI
jgi:hypothetical protein